MKLQRRGGLPLYRQVEQELRRRVEGGELAPGSRLPTEAALSAELGVNRLTVRHAFAELARAGILHARQGVGTFVTEAHPATDVTIRADEYEIRAEGATWEHVEIPGLREETIGTARDGCADARAVLGLDGPLRRVDTLTSHEGRPWLVSSYWVGEERFPDLPAELEVHGSPVAALVGQHGLVLHHVWRSFAAAAASVADAALLDVAPGSPLLVREGLNRDADGVPTVFVRRRCRSDRVRFVLRHDGG